MSAADRVAAEPDAEAGGWDVIIVGAGIAGLAAAGKLIAAGRRVLVVEKSRGIGGRMATRRIGAAVCDHGAQFFTVRGRAFGGLVAEAHEAGAVAVWCDGFARAQTVAGPVSAAVDGHARWRGARGMTDLPKRLAALAVGRDHPGRCDIRTAAEVTSVTVADGRVLVAFGSEVLTAAALILTPPVPQSLTLLAAVGIDSAVRQELEAVAYDPCFALMLVLDRPSRVPPPGAIQFAADATGAGTTGDHTPGDIAWLADNFQKGISPVPALTVHASGRFSREHFDHPPAEVAARLLEQVRPWLDGDPATCVVERSLHRWKFAQPTTLLEQPLVAACHTPPIVCCGDAFAGPRVEGAAASGLAAGRWVVRMLTDRETGDREAGNQEAGA